MEVILDLVIPDILIPRHYFQYFRTFVVAFLYFLTKRRGLFRLIHGITIEFAMNIWIQQRYVDNDHGFAKEIYEIFRNSEFDDVTVELQYESCDEFQPEKVDNVVDDIVLTRITTPS